MAKNDSVVALDIGTTKTVALIGKLVTGQVLRITGFSECPSVGLRKGNIVDLEMAAKAVEQTVEAAEQMSGRTVTEAYLGIGGSNIGCLNSRGIVAVADDEISSVDMAQVLQASKEVNVNPDRKILHLLPRSYVVDGYDGIIDPVGMAGSRLEVETHVITAGTTAVQNYLKCIQRAGLKTRELVVNALGSADIVLAPAEKDLGAVVLDIGGGTTDLVIYQQGSPLFTTVLPIGGDHITNDLAIGLRTSFIQAEQIKREHGQALVDYLPDDNNIPVGGVIGQDTRYVSARLVASIIEPRVREIFGLVYREITHSGFRGPLPGGVVLTGGVALLPRIGEVAAEILQLSARIGRPRGLPGLADDLGSPVYSSVVGILNWAAQRHVFQGAEATDPLLGSLVSKVRSWLREIF